MSLAKIKAKENKGKQKLLPKLKTILANPVKNKSPTLDDDALEFFANIIRKAISESREEAKKYVTSKHIHLGLESSLRAINNQQSSCVFISLSIKPNHIISLVARNAEIKDETQPVYAQPRLEDFTEKLFGIRALCMVLPKDLKSISEDLWIWVEKRRKHKSSISKTNEIAMVKKKSKRKSLGRVINKTQEETDVNKEKVEEIVETSKSWQGDFISFGKSESIKYRDENEILDNFSRLLDNVPKVEKKTVEDIQPMEVINEEPPPKNCSENIDYDELDDSDDFLGEYKPLTVHRIKPNPNKKPKKKRNKNKNKNTKTYIFTIVFPI
ncbi:uncharacterized protein LOC142221796 [Haematobia irritans]|uniref:uncharacterized protein LOC142221796 n=1 Tax=Haematobia irritans TaxID=7368 RepID=UPI003F50C853